MRVQRGAVLLGLVVVMAAGACEKSGAESDSGGTDLSTVEPIEGTDVARVTLTQDAAARIDLQTAPVRLLRGSDRRLEIPYAAVLYDPEGETWTYTSPEPLVFIRAPITVARIQGSTAFLSSGPPAGTEVVTVGAAELLGTEYEVGEE
jgi:hypothetical protein